MDKPLLGLASTRDLLEELDTRMRITQNSTRGRELGAFCREALRNLDANVLSYRTIGPWDNDPQVGVDFSVADGPFGRMVVCPVCGNKRCPKANDDRLPCSGSNEPGQPGGR